MSRALVIAPAPGDGGAVRRLCADGWTAALATAEPLDGADAARDLRQAGIPVFDGSTAELETIVEAGRYTLVVCTTWQIAELYLPTIRKLAPAACVLVECAGLHLARGARGELGPDYGGEAAAELDVYRAADAVLTATQADASLLDALLADELAAPSFAAALALAQQRHGSRPLPAAPRGSRELFEQRLHRQRCRAAAPAIRGLAAALPGDERILVLAGDARELVSPGDERVALFPPAEPSDSDEAIEQLEQEMRAGARHLLVPEVSAGWLAAYPAFADRLLELPSRRDGDCTIVELLAPEEPAVAERSAAAPRPVRRLRRPPVRLVAFYLPQFHPIPENDAWWGAGFTEWTNVGRGRPLYPGHEQPRVPGELGFYDLRLAETREAQARLAADAGIEAFCYYHYWFHGARLLETPFTEVLESGRPDFPFCLCWANEPWSRRWDGGDDDVLQPQRYSAEDDLAHITALLPALADPRALTVDGKPVFLVYDVRALPDPARTADLWRREVRKAGLAGIHLVGVEKRHDPGWNATLSGFDATVRFQPQFTTLLGLPPVDVAGAPEGLRVWDYEEAWTQLARADPPAYRRYESVCTGWDNTPRRGGSGWVIQNATPDSYGRWLAQVGSDALAEPAQQRLVFINAWNEWAEGAYLEPDRTHGRAYLEATRAALRRIAGEPEAELEPEPVTIAVAEPQPPAAETVEDPDDELPLGDEPRARAVAFYLPQFHPTAENDEWWGPGFTEWTNVVRAEPLYPGHYQPHIPAHLGFYDLRVPQAREAQAELARAYGIEAFCYWHYWFSGKRLLERPFDEVLASGQPDFPFCLAWANETWSRRWLGETRDVLIEQEYSPRDDVDHARWLAEAFADPRYLRVLGRPVFVVYRPRWLPDARRTADTIKSESVRAGLPEPLVLGTTSWDGSDCRAFGLDGTIEFEPRLSALGDPTGDELDIHDYTDARARMRVVRDFPVYPSIVVSWDNTARRGMRGTVLANATPQAFERGFRELVASVQDRPFADRLVFVNAWNEWAEGNHLEPDLKHGLGYLEAVRRVVYARHPGLVFAGASSYDRRSVAVTIDTRGE